MTDDPEKMGRQSAAQRASFLRRILGLWRKRSEEPVGGDEEDEYCCDGVVHVAYRGLSDDRLYIAHSRQWAEVKYFRQGKLRVFCAACRRRLL